MLKRMSILMFVAAVAITLVGCASREISVDYDASAKAPESLSTYRWLPTPPSKDPRINSPHLDAVVQKSVDEQLTAKGYSKTTAAEASFQVTYHAVLEDKVEADVLDQTYANRQIEMYTGDKLTSEAVERSYDQGTLVLDFSMQEEPSLYWRGSAQAEVHLSSSQDEQDARIHDAVELILKRFPDESRF